jgi:hypothetical protein
MVKYMQHHLSRSLIYRSSSQAQNLQLCDLKMHDTLIFENSIMMQLEPKCTGAARAGADPSCSRAT